MEHSGITINTMAGKTSRIYERQMPDRILTDKKDALYYVGKELEIKISLENLDKLSEMALKK